MYSTIAPEITHSEMPAVQAAASASRSPQRQVIGEERLPRPLWCDPAGGPACGICGANVLIRVLASVHPRVWYLRSGSLTR